MIIYSVSLWSVESPHEQRVDRPQLSTQRMVGGQNWVKFGPRSC